MTESEIINFCMTNYNVMVGKNNVSCNKLLFLKIILLQNEPKIRQDLRNLEILTFNNPEWGISVVQKEDNSGIVTEDDIAKSMVSILKSNVIFKNQFTGQIAINSIYQYLKF